MKMVNGELRDYQLAMKTRLLEAWQGLTSVMVQMPTGTGKTHLLASVVSDFVSPTGWGQVWIIAHRRELVAQIEETLAKYGIAQADKRVRAMSIQWLSRHWEEVGETPKLIVIDEAHHALAHSYAELWRRYPKAKKLGMTATPCRLNRKGFTNLFDRLIPSWSIAEFIERGELSVFDYVSIRPDSEDQRLIEGLEKCGADGDYQVKEMNAVLNKRPAIERLYRSVEQFAQGKKGMVYAISIDHARQIAAYYGSRGVKAAAIDSRTPALERKQLVEAFRCGEVEVLVNVDVFSEGFDCPDVEFVQLARPTLSLAKYLQQVGRGLRKSEGKEACMLIDNVGLYRIFGLPTRRWNWKALFEGRESGKGSLPGRAGLPDQVSCNVSELTSLRVASPSEIGQRADELVVVMEHDRLLSSLREQYLSTEVDQSSPLKAFLDKETNRWGLYKGEETRVEALFSEILGIKDKIAVGRLPNMCVRVVDDAGYTVGELDNCLKVRFLKNDLLLVFLKGGATSYMDLRNGRCYNVKPRLLRYGSIELLQVSGDYYSRTKQVYINRCTFSPLSIDWMNFYVKMYDSNIPSSCRRVGDGVFFQESSVCLLEGDEACAYYLSGQLADRSILVMDSEERYYHVVKGHGKRYVACNHPSDSCEDFDVVMPLLQQQAEERLAERLREKERKVQMERQKLIDKSKEAAPYRVGIKWGLKTEDRILIPPIYRRILSPVGGYCAYQDSSCQWGVLTLDGRIVIGAKYMEVEIDSDGTARLTLVPGKTERKKLKK